MTPSDWFDDLPVLGALPPAAAAPRLREIGEIDAAQALESVEPAPKDAYGRPRKLPWPFSTRPWQHTAHAFGYMAPADPGPDPLPIHNPGAIPPDESLKRGRITVTLDRLRVADYPGGGTHQVLFDFYAQNHLPTGVEHLHFNATYRVREGEHAAVVGYPLFVGLHVGAAGAAFKCYTVNVKNDADEAFLSFLDSDAFKAGLKLITTLQPAVGPYSATALALVKAIAARSRNVPIQDVQMGLDFSRVATGARLAEGSYLAVQIPETIQTVWRWDDWVYDRAAGRVVRRDDRAQLIPYNYFVFGVRRYEGD